MLQLLASTCKDVEEQQVLGKLRRQQMVARDEVESGT